MWSISQARVLLRCRCWILRWRDSCLFVHLIMVCPTMHSVFHTHANEYTEQYLQSPFQLEHACELLLDSELFTFHSERMCEILVDDAQSVSYSRLLSLLLNDILITFADDRPPLPTHHLQHPPAPRPSYSKISPVNKTLGHPHSLSNWPHPRWYRSWCGGHVPGRRWREGWRRDEYGIHDSDWGQVAELGSEVALWGLPGSEILCSGITWVHILVHIVRFFNSWWVVV